MGLLSAKKLQKIILILLCSTPQISNAEWFSMMQLKEYKHQDFISNLLDIRYVQNASFYQYWAGRFVEFESKKTQGGGALFPFTSVKIRITHTTDKSPYKCGQIVHFRLEDNNFTIMDKRSFALSSCD